MYMVTLIYSDAGTQIFPDVSKISYIYLGEEIVVEGEAILTHKFPITVDLHMTSDSTNYIASKDKLKAISIMNPMD